ncbi:hypothetical protein AYI68_g1126 [Smittium mucronatum]|uniref:Uncharacterized protein n=1 Tax=Smittium mucronatum TaxID=133383 RepID=A0A1R0H6I5_9FUNG|nr:hypothetical protein AYI68_g1126 [Smittium mucronatum]
MGIVTRNHELVESGAYPYGFAPEVDVWREVVEDRDSEASTSVSMYALELSGDLDPSVDLAGEPVMEELVSSLLGLSLSSGPNPPVRFSPVIPTVVAVQTLSVFSTGSNGRSADRWMEDRDSEASTSVSMYALELSGDLDPSVDLAGEPVMEELVSSLLGLSLSSGPNPPVRFSPVIPTVVAVQTLSVFSTGSNGRSADRWSKGVIPALKSLLGEGEEDASNSALGVASPLAVQQQFRSEDLYQSNWYRESASDNKKKHLYLP